MLGSYCWFTAFTLQVAALVYAVGQVELVFSVMASLLVFRERIMGREVVGLLILTASIIALIAVT